MNIERSVPLSRLTTVGIGGPARHFARPQSVAELEEALRWAAAEGLDVFTIGLGWEPQILDDPIPADPWDMPLDAIATPAEWIACR